MIVCVFIGIFKILFVDEFLVNFDSKNGKFIELLLFELNKEYGMIFILVIYDE